MKTLNLITFTIIAGLAILFVSCEKEKAGPDLADLVVGTYTGTISETPLKAGVTATTDVTKSDYNKVTIHTYSTAIDTTFMMELFENGDSLMVCNLGDDFFRQYGHDRMGQHHMMGSSSDLDWMHHMDEEHQPGEEHFGGFNMTNHTFGYKYIMNDTGGDFALLFNGTRQ